MKQIVYYSPKVLEEVATITGEYFTIVISGCSFIEDAYYENNRVRVMQVSHTMTLMSYGENYHFVFERLPDPKMQTRITVSVSLKFGYGAQWKKPSDILIKWAELIGSEPIDFGRKPFIITWVVIVVLLATVFLVPIIFIWIL
ncbi:MAG: hypothetical protein FK734_02025 [Asgard group archaeon]|nr:hypothetical protein [Asgard group archaeon]